MGQTWFRCLRSRHFISYYFSNPLSFQVRLSRVDAFPISLTLSVILGDIPRPEMCIHWVSNPFTCGPISTMRDAMSRRKALTRDAASITSITDAILLVIAQSAAEIPHPHFLETYESEQIHVSTMIVCGRLRRFSACMQHASKHVRHPS